MSDDKRYVDIESHDGKSFAGLLALPENAASAPAIVLVPHIGGISDDMWEMAKHYAAYGFIVCVPDVFWRVHPGPAGGTEEGRAIARSRAEAVDVDTCVKDIGSTLEMLKRRPEANGNAGVIGYCFGGLYAYLSTTRLNVKEAAAFHGVGIGGYLSEAPAVAGDLSLHFGAADPIVPMDEVRAIQNALQSDDEAAIFIYPGAAHNFTALGRPTYDISAAKLSEARALTVLSKMF